MTFQEALQSLKSAGPGAWTASIGADWEQGRTLFGGLQAALAMRAIRELLPDAPPLRTLQVTFIAPLSAAKVRIEARLLRQGKSAMHVEARLYDGEQLAALMIAVLGASRESTIAIAPPPVTAKPPEQSQLMPFIAGIAPAFLQHLKLQWASGAFPFCGGKEARTQIWVELRDIATIDESAAIAIADAIPSPAVSLFRKPTPASSLSWMLEFLGPPLDQPAAPWLMDAVVSSAADGYVSQTATLFNERGIAVALSRQSVVIFG